jgi:hypothetical protein
MASQAVENSGNRCDVVYVDCTEKDEIDSEKLSSIVDYAMSKILENKSNGIVSTKSDWSVWPFKREKPDVDTLRYIKFCDALEKKLGRYEPYHRSARLMDRSKERIIEGISDLLPRKDGAFEKVIKHAADSAHQTFELPIKKLNEIIMRSHSQEFIFSEFIILKVFRSGDNLEITPCHMQIKSERSQGKFLNLDWAESVVNMEYEERKFILTKFMIKEIIKKLREQDYGF